MKVAIYTRVSTHMQAEKGISLDAQKNELIEYCNKNNYDYDIFEDAGISGKNIAKRKELEEMGKQLKLFQKEASIRMMELQNLIYERNMHQGKGK